MFGMRLKELRQGRGLTIEEFANEVGISKSSIGYYENQNRVPDIVVAGRIADVLNVSADYLIGRSNARTQMPKLKSICDKTGLSDKSILMLSRLKKEKSSKLRIINLLLEQADSDIEDDYEFDGIYDGSVLNAICRYLDGSTDKYLGEEFEDYSTDPRRYDRIRCAVRKMIFDQAVEAIKTFDEPIHCVTGDTFSIVDKESRGEKK